MLGYNRHFKTSKKKGRFVRVGELKPSLEFTGGIPSEQCPHSPLGVRNRTPLARFLDQWAILVCTPTPI